MSDIKFGYSAIYGFGVIRENTSPYFFNFIPSIRVTIRDLINPRSREIYIDTGFQDISIQRKNYNNEISRVKVPLFLMCESGVWKEYFTGEEVEVVDSKYLRKYKSGDIDMDLMRIEDSKYREGFISWAKQEGIRKFVINISIELSADKFANMIAEYTEEEIQQIVLQYYDLKDKAKEFGPRLEKEMADIVDEVYQNNSEAVLNLEKKAGAYARENRKCELAAASSSEDSNANTDSAEQSDRKEDKDSESIINGTIAFAALLVVALLIIISKFVI
jgi:hypothetical protein